MQFTMNPRNDQLSAPTDQDSQLKKPWEYRDPCHISSFTIGYRKASLMSLFLHSCTPYGGLIPQPLKSIQLLLGRAIPDKVQSLALIEFLILLFLIRKTSPLIIYHYLATDFLEHRYIFDLESLTSILRLDIPDFSGMNFAS